MQNQETEEKEITDYPVTWTQVIAAYAIVAFMVAVIVGILVIIF